MTSNTPFTITKVDIPYAGTTAHHVLFESAAVPEMQATPDKWGTPNRPLQVRRAVGRAVSLQTNMVDLQIYPFMELIHRSWMPGTPHFVRLAPTINLGTKLSDFVFDQGGPELRDLPRYEKKAWSEHRTASQ